jgi:hypothetical protein
VDSTLIIETDEGELDISTGVTGVDISVRHGEVVTVALSLHPDHVEVDAEALLEFQSQREVEDAV